ncbi:MAG: tetratricopeptide repeat protein, partial [Lewinella sp.]
MSKGIYLAWLLPWLLTSRAPAQSPSASVALDRLEISWEKDLERTLDVLDSLQEHHPEMDSVQLIKCKKIRGRVERKQGEYVNAIRTWKGVHTYATAHGDSLLLAEAANQIGIMNTFMGNLLEGQQYLLQVANIYERIGSDGDRAGAYNGLAILNSDLDQEEEAIELYNRALGLYESVDDTLGRANVHANLGLLYLYRGEYDRSEAHLREQGRLDSLMGSSYGLAFHYDFLATLRDQQGRHEEALDLALRGLKLREELPSHYNRAESFNSVAGILLGLDRYAEARAYAQKVLDFREDHESLSQQSIALRVLSEAYEAEGEPGAALRYYREFHTISDSIYRRDHLSEIANKNALYEKATQDREIAELGQQQLMNAAELRRKDTALMIVGISLGIISFFAVMIWLLFRKISHQKERLEDIHDQKDLLLREIHHRVKNNLQMVCSLLSLQRDFIQDPAALDAIDMGRQRVRSMAIIHQRMYLRDTVTTAVNAKEYLQQLIGEVIDTLNVRDLPLRVQQQLESIELDIDRLMPLGLIANEVITNSMKHAFTGRISGELSVSFTRQGGNYELRRAENGRG